jgi:hypothetical protein
LAANDLVVVDLALSAQNIESAQVAGKILWNKELVQFLGEWSGPILGIG